MKLSNLPVRTGRAINKYRINGIEYIINEANDNFHEYWYVPNAIVQQAVNGFTLALRNWQAYSVDKIELMLIYSGVIKSGFHYKELDPDTNELIFVRMKI